MSEHQAWQQRVIDERNELRVKLDNLIEFIEKSNRFLQLPNEDQFLLAAQRNAMSLYINILTRRINKFK